MVAGLFLSRQQAVGLLAIGLMLAVGDIIRKRKLDHHTNAPR